jgi:hypothetical protein
MSSRRRGSSRAPTTTTEPSFAALHTRQKTLTNSETNFLDQLKELRKQMSSDGQQWLTELDEFHVKTVTKIREMEEKMRTDIQRFETRVKDAHESLLDVHYRLEQNTAILDDGFRETLPQEEESDKNTSKGSSKNTDGDSGAEDQQDEDENEEEEAEEEDDELQLKEQPKGRRKRGRKRKRQQ